MSDKTPDDAPTLAELLALPYEERNRRIKLALERSQTYEHDDLEGYTDADFNDGADRPSHSCNQTQ
jgi:hypothetical protein